jgi:hypothetical protein
MLAADAPCVPFQVVDPAARPEPAGTTGSVDDLLTELGRAANAAADRIGRVPASEWTRAATLDDGSGRTVTALDVARRAVDAGVSHLRAAGVVLAAVRDRSPASPERRFLHVVSPSAPRGRRAVLRSGGAA